MKSVQYIILGALLLLLAYDSYGQQDAQYTQYMYNTLSVNPAYAGSREALNITGIYRTQWVGIDGAPETQTLNIHSPIGCNEKVGLGFSVINDNIGPTQETYFDIDFSYTIKTSFKDKLSFGLKAGGHLLNIAYSELNPFTTGDDLFQNNLDNKFSPNIGVGLYYRHLDVWYLGFSAPNILETTHFDVDLSQSVVSTAKEQINYYFIGGYVFDLNKSLKLKPAFLTKAVAGAPLQLDLSTNLWIKERVSLGLAWRWSAAVSAMAGFQVTDQIMIGFAYDKETTDLGQTNFNSGSYEAILRFEIFKKCGKIISPRFF